MGGGPPPAPVRYAVRQVLDQEHRKELLHLRSQSRLARDAGPNNNHHNYNKQLEAPTGDGDDDDDKENSNVGKKKKQQQQQASSSSISAKRDFFGRIVNEARPGSAGKGLENAASKAVKATEERVWISFHEGFSNAVRKPISLREFLESF